MKGSKVLLVIMAVAMMTLGLSGVSYAFHDGGVASCDSCHTMHNAAGTTGTMAGGKSGGDYAYKGSTTPFMGNPYLLQGSDQSSTCLNCHAVVEAKGGSYHIMSPDAGTTGLPTHFTPGGDFGWLLATPVSATTSYDKTRRGHNINAMDWGLGSSFYSVTLTSAPGGTYKQTDLHCSSCHDPHGTYRHTKGDPTQTGDIASSVFTTGGAAGSIVGSGSYGVLAPTGSDTGVYRLLAGKNYLPMSAVGEVPFNNDSPIAVAPGTYDIVASTFGIAAGAAGSTEVVVQYGTGMSEWCANCHTTTGTGGILAGVTNHIHPASSTDTSAKMSNVTVGTNTIAANYNSYVYSGNMVAGSNLYTSLVPVELGAGNLPAALPAGSSSPSTLNAPSVTGSANVACISCHRAHAGAWQNMTRFDVADEMTTINGAYASVNVSPAPRGAIYSNAQYVNGMEGRPATVFAANQRILCNKCHAKD